MDSPRTTTLDRIILLFAGVAAGVGVGGATGVIVGSLTALFGVGFHPGTAFFGFGIGDAIIGAFAGSIGGFLLAVVYTVIPSRVAGALAGAVVGTFVPYYLNAGTFIGNLGLVFFVTSIVGGTAAGYTMIVIFQRMDASANKRR